MVPARRRRLSLSLVLLMLGTLTAADLGAAPVRASTSGSSGPRPTSQPPSQPPTSYARIESALAHGAISPTREIVLVARAIYAPDTLPPPFRAPIGRDATLAGIRFDAGVGLLHGKAARVVDRLSTAAALGQHWCHTSTDTLPNVKKTAHFAIFYDVIGGGLTIGQYASVLENVWNTEIGSFGWAAPPVSTASPAPGNLYPVRIADAGVDTYGYVAGDGAHAGLVGDNPATSWTEPDAKASCMVLNPGFEGFGSANNLDDLKVTAAHEFTHSIQFGLGVTDNADSNYIEGAAAWMEDEVYDSINDNVQYLWPHSDESMGAYLNSNPEWYGYWLVWRGLTERFGTTVPGGAEDVMQAIFENISKGQDLLPATRNAFWDSKHMLFDYVFNQFAAAYFFLKQCGGGYVEPYCFGEMSVYQVVKPAVWSPTGVVTKTKIYNGAVKDDYATNWIQVPDAPKTYPISIKNLSSTSPLFLSVACDTGTALNVQTWGTVAPNHRDTPYVHRTGCAGHSYLIITSDHESAPNPVSSPTINYKAWVPYIPMHGTVSWTATGTASGASGSDTWSESWNESGSLTVALARKPTVYSPDILVSTGSTYAITYSRTRTEYTASSGCTTTYNGSGTGSGPPDLPQGFIGGTFPNLDPPDPTDGYQDLLYLGAAGLPFTFNDSWGGGCGSGSQSTSLSGPFVHDHGAAPVCVPAGVNTADPNYEFWDLVGIWNQAAKNFGFACSSTGSVTGGSQDFTISGTISYNRAIP